MWEKARGAHQQKHEFLLKKAIDSAVGRWYLWWLAAAAIGTGVPVLAHELLQRLSPSGRIDTPVVDLVWSLYDDQRVVTGAFGGGPVATNVVTVSTAEDFVKFDYVLYPPGVNGTGSYLFASGQSYREEITLTGGVTHEVQLVLRMNPEEICARSVIMDQVGVEECAGE